jgi:hypothetical protein
MGSVRVEPPPAPTFIIPAINAITNKIITETISCNINPIILRLKYTTLKYQDKKKENTQKSTASLEV